uniref:Ig-like domain-containing protein n=1 Tax=Seriola lalandi dorsalis TaxID=1841481 RepID=A0A3B4WZ65_SERLL
PSICSFISQLLLYISISYFCVTLSFPQCRSESYLNGSPQPIIARVGDDIILPCHLEPEVDVVGRTLEWTRPDLKNVLVVMWRKSEEFEKAKDPSYRGRSSLFPDELKHGNISLKLSKVKLSDKGKYKCFIPEYKVKGSELHFFSGTDRDKGGAVLQCESKGWYPEPELLWLDGEGKLLSAGPTETVRGPDDLYTVSSRSGHCILNFVISGMMYGLSYKKYKSIKHQLVFSYFLSNASMIKNNLIFRLSLSSQMETKEAELLELQEEKQRQEENLQRLIEERETKNKEVHVFKNRLVHFLQSTYI